MLHVKLLDRLQKVSINKSLTLYNKPSTSKTKNIYLMALLYLEPKTKMGATFSCPQMKWSQLRFKVT